MQFFTKLLLERQSSLVSEEPWSSHVGTQQLRDLQSKETHLSHTRARGNRLHASQTPSSTKRVPSPSSATPMGLQPFGARWVCDKLQELQLSQGKEESIALSPSQNHEDFNVNIPVAEIPAMCQAIQALKGSDRSLLFAFPQSHSLLPATVLMSPGQVRDFYQHQRLPRPVEHYNLLLGNKESFLHETRLEEQLLCLGETRLRFG
ncbi:hypothetical protein Anapl_07484 [Anas platyrhynchos]|uniref:Uncharacterized protein n=1 Tax=Anas platyrhynchos TaxID=8839 RepID=R0KF24_ANAPL|nr:hypothetical protein Anapl_07484 [Anas platyrhynchos]